ncbi:GNAT family N-acetyltransferase [Bacillus alkalicola]|uniref:GNAT family N-acetyltransferase n=2 Tax=Bacillaceae TaxID=186817 RepID=A0ABS6JX86_9BACI|nr:GNAT family N-acetyltransferase [Bacillus alkalicola]MBU9722842.1 GNAT family N-acetyltransferase [Bacillus alkalicola]
MTKSVSAEQLSTLFEKSGIRRPIDDLKRLQKMLENADLTFTAWDNDKLVGIARSVTDFSYCCYLSDLAVDQDYQKKGIGKELVRRTKDYIGDEVTLVLVSAPAAMEYYPILGFEKLDNAFAIKKKR